MIKSEFKKVFYANVYGAWYLKHRTWDIECMCLDTDIYILFSELLKSTKLSICQDSLMDHSQKAEKFCKKQLMVWKPDVPHETKNKL